MLVERLDIFDFKVTLTTAEFELLKQSADYDKISLEQMFVLMFDESLYKWVKDDN